MGDKAKEEPKEKVKEALEDEVEKVKEEVKEEKKELPEEAAAECPADCQRPKVATGDPSNGGIVLQDGKCTGFASMLYGQYRYCGAPDAAAYNGAGSVDCKCCASPPPAECTTAPKAVKDAAEEKKEEKKEEIKEE